MPGKAPHLKIKVKSLLHRQEALSLVSQGWPITKISEKMGMAVQSVRRLLRQALATESMFPSSLTPERVAELRVLEAEQIAASTRKVIRVQDNAIGRLRDSNPRTQADAESTVIRAHEALVRSSERLAKLFGLDMPLKIQEEQFRMSVVKTDNRVQIVWDPSILKGDGRPVEGLTIKAAPALLEAARLRNSNGQIAEGSSNAPINDSGVSGVDGGGVDGGNHEQEDQAID
jgi:hypothetical protein